MEVRHVPLRWASRIRNGVEERNDGRDRRHRGPRRWTRRPEGNRIPGMGRGARKTDEFERGIPFPSLSDASRIHAEHTHILFGDWKKNGIHNRGLDHPGTFHLERSCSTVGSSTRVFSHVSHEFEHRASASCERNGRSAASVTSLHPSEGTSRPKRTRQTTVGRRETCAIRRPRTDFGSRVKP